MREHELNALPGLREEEPPSSVIETAHQLIDLPQLSAEEVTELITSLQDAETRPLPRLAGEPSKTIVPERLKFEPLNSVPDYTTADFEIRSLVSIFQRVRGIRVVSYLQPQPLEIQSSGTVITLQPTVLTTKNQEYVIRVQIEYNGKSHEIHLYLLTKQLHEVPKVYELLRLGLVTQAATHNRRALTPSSQVKVVALTLPPSSPSPKSTLPTRAIAPVAISSPPTTLGTNRSPARLLSSSSTPDQKSKPGGSTRPVSNPKKVYHQRHSPTSTPPTNLDDVPTTGDSQAGLTPENDPSLRPNTRLKYAIERAPELRPFFHNLKWYQNAHSKYPTSTPQLRLHGRHDDTGLAFTYWDQRGTIRYDFVCKNERIPVGARAILDAWLSAHCSEYGIEYLGKTGDEPPITKRVLLDTLTERIVELEHGMGQQQATIEQLTLERDELLHRADHTRD